MLAMLAEELTSDPTLEPKLNPVFSVLFLLSLLSFLVVEVIGVQRKKRGDTFTENWRWLEANLPPWTSWLFRIFTGGLLMWALLHFLAGAD